MPCAPKKPPPPPPRGFEPGPGPSANETASGSTDAAPGTRSSSPSSAAAVASKEVPAPHLPGRAFGFLWVTGKRASRRSVEKDAEVSRGVARFRGATTGATTRDERFRAKNATKASKRDAAYGFLVSARRRTARRAGRERFRRAKRGARGATYPWFRACGSPLAAGACVGGERVGGRRGTCVSAGVKNQDVPKVRHDRVRRAKHARGGHAPPEARRFPVAFPGPAAVSAWPASP